MTNIELMEKALPTAPLKIAALESCKDLAEKVDQYIVSFRKNSLHDFLDPAIYSSMKQILILQRTVAHVLVRGKQRECLAKVSAEKISLLWWMSATTA